MHVQYFPNHESPNKPLDSEARLNRLGIKGNIMFITMQNRNYHKIYAIDVRFPTNWHLINRLDMAMLNYMNPVLSPDGKFIFVFFLRVSESEFTFAVQKIDTRTREETLYHLPDESMHQIYEIPLDNIKTKCGDDYQVVLYDRTIIQGEIPFWTLRLNEEQKTLSILKNSIGVIGADADNRSALFTIAVDPVKRCFAKLMGPLKMLVYTEDRKKWVEYMIPPEVSLTDIFGTDGFPIQDNRSIRETYGTHGHRVGAMQTKLTFHDQDGWVVARVLHNDRQHTTAVVEFDHGKQEINIRKLASFHIDERVSKMFYIMTSPEFHVFLGVHHSAIVFIRKPTLEELSGWTLQIMLRRDGFGEEVAQCTNHNQLKTLGFAKYSEQDELMTEQLRQLGIKEPEPKLCVRDFPLD